VIKDQRVDVHLEPGQRDDRHVVHLERLPARIAFAEAWDASCAVLVDGSARGTLGALSRVVEIADPESPHDVELDCRPRGERVDRHYDRLGAQVLRFEDEAPP
jgi:hypothetical protein